MDLLLTEDQQAILDATRDVLGAAFSLERLREGRAPFNDGARALWLQLAELGWFALGLPEAAGGLGLGAAEEFLLQRELGRHSVTPTVLTTVLAAHAAAALGKDALAASLAEGSARAALIVPAALLQPGVETPVYIIDGADADWGLAWSQHALWLVSRSALQSVQPVDGVDALLLHERATLDLGRVEVVSDAALTARAELLLAAQLTGLAEASRDLAVEYAKVREQFGKPIGSFQAVKHRCADMAIACEVAYCQSAWAAVTVRDGAASAARDVAAARMLAQRAAEDNAAAAVQVHGAMGFTDEAGIHHYLKRALLLGKAGGAATLREALLA